MSKVKVEIKTEELQKMVKLKEDGKSDDYIADYFTQKGKPISTTTVAKRLIEYYKSQGEERKRTKIYIKPIEVTKEQEQEMIKLAEEGNSYAKIAELLKSKNKDITVSVVYKRVSRYYEAQGKEKPKAKSERKPTIPLTEEELQEIVKFRQDGLTYQQISEHLIEQGTSISRTTVRIKILEYYKVHGEPKRERKYEDNLKEILMTGMTIEEFISEFEKEDEKESIEKELKGLRFIAECSKKEDGEFVADNNFLKVLDIIEDSSEIIKWYEGNTDRYVSDGKCRKGNIDLIKEKVFNENTDLMLYTVSRMNLTYHPGYDMRAYNIMKAEYEQKIDKYLERLYSIENNRRKSKVNSENGSNLEVQDEER